MAVLEVFVPMVFVAMVFVLVLVAVLFVLVFVVVVVPPVVPPVVPVLVRLLVSVAVLFVVLVPPGGGVCGVARQGRVACGGCVVCGAGAGDGGVCGRIR